MGPAMALSDPVYLAIVDDDTLRSTISKGRPGTAMSAFAQKEGGMLTDEQVNAIIHGIRERWSKPNALAGAVAPPYAAKAPGSPAAGRERCTRRSAHRATAPGAKGGPKAGSVTNGAYLSLISDQGLRTIVITGRPDFGAPDWRDNVPGHPMTDQQISDVVAWLVAQRPKPADPDFFCESIFARRNSLSDQDKNEISRRDLFAKIGMLLNGLAVVILATPVIGYLVSPILGGERGQYKRWIALGELDEFPEGQTRLAKFQNPISGVADGETDNIPCWVRRMQGEQFQVFAVNCAHLGCPVRWFAQSGLFMCPCHGGVYYQDGSRASGPPPRGLFEYPYKVEGGKLLIEAGQLPTLSTTASLDARKSGCQG